MIVSAKEAGDGTFIITLDDGRVWSNIGPASRLWRALQGWIATGNIPDPADPPPPPPTNDEIYDAVIRSQKVLRAVVLSINDGTLVPGANVSGAALKVIVKANM